MERIYLKILELDKFDTAEIASDSDATHSVMVAEEDFTLAVEFLNKYLNQIKPYLPFDPEMTSGPEAWS